MVFSAYIEIGNNISAREFTPHLVQQKKSDV